MKAKKAGRPGRPASKTPTVPVMVRIRADQLAALDKLAHAKGVERAALIKMGIAEMIKQG